eukprot:XP_027303842.1 ankyrin repeat, SAM and basic leucine zipper domain-containing protein 1-like [Anas platyrhynchos]
MSRSLPSCLGREGEYTFCMKRLTWNRLTATNCYGGNNTRRMMKGVSIEPSFQFGWTPLMCAASVADFAVVRLLLDRGANACFEIDKYTVLMAACAAHASEENILKTVELLLSRNVDPNLTCRPCANMRGNSGVVPDPVSSCGSSCFLK